MKQSLIAIIFFLSVRVYAQDLQWPTLRQMGHSAKDFAPSGWTVVDSIRGDLNGDKRDDIACVIQKNDSVTVVNNEGTSNRMRPKIFFVALVTKDGIYRLQATNKKLYLNYDRPPTYDDPARSIAIEDQVLTINFAFDFVNGNFYFYTYQFRLQGDQFILTRGEFNYVTRRNMNYEKTVYYFTEKKMSVTVGQYGDEDPPKLTETTEWFELIIERVRTLRLMESPGSWQVTGGKRL